MTSDTLTAVNHHSWTAESWQQLMTLPTNFSGLQQPSLVNFDNSILLMFTLWYNANHQTYTTRPIIKERNFMSNNDTSDMGESNPIN